jgi:NAD(P)-dependent dehydrogenase (short-subunit alcohol dehydrogenase family)
VDAALEASVVGSFSKLGPELRHRTAHWVDPPAARDRTVVVTGATSGLGLGATIRLASLGASVCLVGRDPGRMQDAVAKVQAVADASGADPGSVHAELSDLADLDQVAGLADRLADRLGRIDVLVHNAGALLHGHQSSPQGIEATLAVHVLGPFLLTERLLPVLTGSAPSRVITMASGGLYSQRFELDALEMGSEGYDGVVAYARAKRAQVVLTHEWQRRYGRAGVDFHVVHPGWADTPGLTAGLPTFARRIRPILRTVEQGVDTLVWLAGSPDGSPAGGRLWLDRRPRSEYRVPWTWVPDGRRASDGLALWEWCRNRAGGLLPVPGLDV